MTTSLPSPTGTKSAQNQSRTAVLSRLARETGVAFDHSVKVYLDLCCFNRPFDDQSQLLVRLQTEAKLAIQEAIRSRSHILFWSAILDLENNENPDLERKNAIEQWRPLSEVDVATSAAVESLASVLAGQGLKAMDALHLASAIEGGCDYFLTTDKKVLRKMKNDLKFSTQWSSSAKPRQLTNEDGH